MTYEMHPEKSTIMEQIPDAPLKENENQTDLCMKAMARLLAPRFAMKKYIVAVC